MKHKKLWAAVSKALAATTALLVIVLMLAPGAGAQGHFKTLYKFTGGADGSGPSRLIIDAAGNLYATTYVGGEFGAGTVFKIDTAGKMTTLYNFTGSWEEGHNPPPLGGLAIDAIGNLYGVTSGYLAGTVFKLDTNGVMTVLYHFCELNCSADDWSADGDDPWGGVTFDQRV